MDVGLTGFSEGSEVGLDLGTNTSCIQAVDSASGEEICNTVVPTIVGYADRGILAGILPGDSAELYGDEALENELHLRIARPLKDGVIEDLDAAKEQPQYNDHHNSKWSDFEH